MNAERLLTIAKLIYDYDRGLEIDLCFDGIDLVLEGVEISFLEDEICVFNLEWELDYKYSYVESVGIEELLQQFTKDVYEREVETLTNPYHLRGVSESDFR